MHQPIIPINHPNYQQKLNKLDQMHYTIINPKNSINNKSLISKINNDKKNNNTNNFLKILQQLNQIQTPKKFQNNINNITINKTTLYNNAKFLNKINFHTQPLTFEEVLKNASSAQQAADIKVKYFNLLNYNLKK